jgi:REP element-mobilizing transposase RayT
MRSRYRVRETHAPHFITSTVVAWLPIFTAAARCDILVESIEFCRKRKGLQVFAWVIMDNHFHAIFAAPELSRVMADFGNALGPDNSVVGDLELISLAAAEPPGTYSVNAQPVRLS